MARPGISLILCCYNSAELIGDTLRHIASQQIPVNLPWEVILVDNNSIDNTATIAHKVWNSLNVKDSLTLVYEPQPGLCFARNLGFNTANYEYCLFCDDDNWLHHDYVRLAYQIMQGNDRIGVLGGLGEAVFEDQPPPWFERVKHSYAVGPQAEKSGDVTLPRGYVFGAGAVYRKSVYFKLKEEGFDYLLTGRKGMNVTSGEDAELCYNYVLSGYTIHYSSSLKFKHFIVSQRLTLEYRKKLEASFIQSRVVLSLYRYRLFNAAVLRKRFLWLREVLSSLKKEAKSSALSQNFRQSYSYALLLHYFSFRKALDYLRNS